MSWYRNTVWFVKGLREYTRYRRPQPLQRGRGTVAAGRCPGAGAALWCLSGRCWWGKVLTIRRLSAFVFGLKPKLQRQGRRIATPCLWVLSEDGRGSPPELTRSRPRSPARFVPCKTLPAFGT